MSQPESRLSRRILKALRVEEIFCFKNHGSEHMMAGLPDIIACVDGIFVGFEVKMPGSEANVSKIQSYIHKKISESGGLCYVISSVDEALAIVKQLKITTVRGQIPFDL